MGTVGFHIPVEYTKEWREGLRPEQDQEFGRPFRAHAAGQANTGQSAELGEATAGNKEPSVSRGTVHATLQSVCYVCTSPCLRTCTCVMQI